MESLGRTWACIGALAIALVCVASSLVFALGARAAQPVVSFTRDQANVLVGQQVTFDATVSNDPDDAGALVYEWDFDGDDIIDVSSALPTTDHTFLAQGSVIVKLFVTDFDLEVASNTQTFFVSTSQPPVPRFTVAHPAELLQGDPLQFNATTSTDADGTIVSYLWDLDGNGTFETDTANAPYAQKAYYTGSKARARRLAIGLMVVDDMGDTALTTRLFTVIPYTNRSDIIFGDETNNVLSAGPGNDEILGLEGDDQLWGGAGVDTLDGNDGNDSLDGGDGNDFLYGGAGNDYLVGSLDWNVLYGEEGDDRLVGQDWPDRMYGGDGNDDLAGGRGRDRLYGNGGNDVIHAKDHSPDRVWCGSGIDVVIADRLDSVYNCELKIRV